MALLPRDEAKLIVIVSMDLSEIIQTINLQTIHSHTMEPACYRSIDVS